jgi:protein SCO1
MVQSTNSTRVAWVMMTTLIAACSQGKVALTDFHGGVVNPPVPKPALMLTSQSGEPYDFREETDGHATLLFFGYTYCPDVCPLQMARIAGALRELDQSVVDAIRVVFVSVDPERDTPERLTEWLGAFHESFIGLTGSQQQVGEALQQMSFQPGRVERLEGGAYGVSHASAVIGYTPDNVGRLLYFSGTTQEDFAHDIPLLVRFKGED